MTWLHRRSPGRLRSSLGEGRKNRCHQTGEDCKRRMAILQEKNGAHEKFFSQKKMQERGAPERLAVSPEATGKVGRTLRVGTLRTRSVRPTFSLVWTYLTLAGSKEE